MTIYGFRTQFVTDPSRRMALAVKDEAGAPRRSDSAESRTLAWVLLDAAAAPGVSEAIRTAVLEGKYWVPAQVLSRSILDRLIWVRP